MTNKSPIFKFVSLRNPIIDESNQSLEEVTVSSPLVISLTKISNSSDESTVQLTNYNTELQTYIDSPQYIKTQADLDALAAEISDSPTEEFLNQLYDNILVKSLVKGNTNAIYKKLVDLFKSLYATLNVVRKLKL